MKAAISILIGLVLSVSVGAEPLLEGRVRLESGAPVADAQVRLFDMNDLERGAVGRAMTDDTGYFALPLAALPGMALPERFELGANYPNPFNPSTIIPYQLAALSEVRLEVFNLLGQHLATLVDGERPAGFHTATWNATDAAGRAVGAGVYIYRMTVGTARQTGRMVLIDGQAGVAASGASSVGLGASGGASDGKSAQVYGLIVSGDGLVPYVDSSFRVEAGMAPVELVVSSGSYSAGKATDDDCALCGLFGTFGDQQEEEEETEEEAAETDSTASEGGPDLIVQPPSASAVVLTPGEAFTLQVTVENQGDEQAAATVLHYYRSNNTTISASDTEVGTGAVDALDASATSAESIELTASVGVERYYGACVASVRDESNTDNNCSSAVKITVSEQEEEEDVVVEEPDDPPEEVDDLPNCGGANSPVAIPDANLRAAIETALGKARGAPITVSEMAAFTGLKDLEAPEASIRDLTGLECATYLRNLNLEGNNISDVSPLRRRGLTYLSHLNLEGNNISDVSPLRELTVLKNLNLGGNNISDVSPLRGLTYLGHLNLEGNNISDVSPLRELTYLGHLNLEGNNISDVSPLRELTYLGHLNLEGNNISDVSPLRELTYLGHLNLEGNNISDVSPLRGLTYLEELYLWRNPLSVASIDYITALGRHGVAVSFDLPFRESDFDIELVFLDDSFSENQKWAIQYAAWRWMSIIREDLPDYTFTQGWSGQCGDHSYSIPSGERIDDLRIYITHTPPEYPFNGWGGVRTLRETSHLPVVGCMAFNSPYLSRYLALHEIAHVLGFGTIWDDLGFLRNPSRDNEGADTHFNGPRAIAAFDAAGGSSYTGKKVPVENENSPSIRDVHWRGTVLGAELMASGGGLLFEGYYNKEYRELNAITIQSLADLGYVVDVTQADTHTLPRPDIPSAKRTAQPTHAQPQWSCGTGQQREPIYVVDPQGNIVRTLHR